MNTDKKKILIVEDDGAILQSITDTLDGRYRIESAHSYIAALGKFDKNIDCIVLDLNIGVQNMDTALLSKYFPIAGMCFFDEIKKEIPDIYNKTIIYSGYKKNLMEKCDELGWSFNNFIFIRKSPDSIEEVIKKINEICK